MNMVRDMVYMDMVDMDMVVMDMVDTDMVDMDILDMDMVDMAGMVLRSLENNVSQNKHINVYKFPKYCNFSQK